MTDPMTISGMLTVGDVKRLTRLTRGGVVGPTVVYYAGATASVISAGMALMMREAMRQIHLSDYWVWFVSAMTAAFAGLTWFLIFHRWSYRHQHGRGTELEIETTVTIGQDGLLVKRGPIVTQIGWSAVREITHARKYTAVVIDGADALIIPDAWFAKDKAAIAAFRATLKDRTGL